MKPKDGINFFIHDLNPYGGQDRSTLEILRNLAKKMPVHIYAYTYQAADQEDKNIFFHRCPIQIRRPVLFKAVCFHLWSLWVQLSTPRRLTFSTGTCSLVSDIVHVQFIANTWAEEKNKLEVKKRGLSRYYHFLLSQYNETLERILFSRKKHFAAISQSVARDLRRHFNVENIDVIYHGVDIDRFRPAKNQIEKEKLRETLALPKGAPIFLFVGAYDRKGLATLTKAGKILRQEHPEVKILAVGQGNQECYHQLTGDPRSKDWLLLRGPSTEIEKYYRAADFFVLPTLYEPFGLVILEAMAAGLPVIVSKIAGASELVKDGENGVLLENPSDYQYLAQSMAKLLTLKNYTDLGKNARATAQNHTWIKAANEFESLIQHERVQ